MKIISIVFLCFCFSCGKSNSGEYVNETISLSKREMVLQHGDLLISPYPFINKVVGKDSLLLYDQNSQFLVLFDLKQNNILDKIQLVSDGPNFVEGHIFDAEIRKDSIILLTESYISTLDFRGKVMSRFNLKEISDMTSRFRPNAFQMVGRSEGIFTRTPLTSMIPDIEQNPSEPIFFKYNFVNNSIEFLNIISPKEALLNDLSKGYYSGFYNHYILIKDNYLIYNFRFSSTVYRHNMSTGTTEISHAASSFTKNRRDPLSGNVYKNDIEKTISHAYNGPSFGPIYFDSKSGLFVRVHYELSKKSDGSPLKKTFLMLFNAKFEKVYETKLPDYLVSEPIVNNGQIYLRRIKPRIESGYEMEVYTIESK